MSLPPTDEEKERLYGCSYCCGVGACHRCHGRAAVNEMKKVIRDLLDTMSDLMKRHRDHDESVVEKIQKFKTLY